MDTTDNPLEQFRPFVPLLAPPVLMETDSGDVQLKDDTMGTSCTGSSQLGCMIDVMLLETT